jgi:hypothetical protein
MIVNRRLVPAAGFVAFALVILVLFAAFIPTEAMSLRGSDPTPTPYRVFLPLLVKGVGTHPTYHLVPTSFTCNPNPAITYFSGVVKDRAGDPKNNVCVHIAFWGPRITKCTGCDGMSAGAWAFAPFGGFPAPAGIPVEVFIVPCPTTIPPGGQTSGFGDLTPLSDKWRYSTTSTSMQCTGITFMED